MNFLEWQALHGWGVTLRDLYDWEMGAWNSTDPNKDNRQPIPVWFKEKIVAWYELHNTVLMHQQEAVSKASRKK
jgi:hypothetical protein